MKILFIDQVHPDLERLLTAEGYVCIDGSRLAENEIRQSIKEYSGIVIRSRIKIDKSFLDAGTNLQFIARAGAGMENIDVEYAVTKGIKCLPSAEGNRQAVGEHVLAMLLALFNKLVKADKEVRNNEWLREPNRGNELNGKTVGIIGFGMMGSAFAKTLYGFDCNMIAYDKYLPGNHFENSEKEKFPHGFAKRVSMEQLFEETDILSLHVPLTSETKWMVDELFINRFKKKIILINSARGKVVKTSDLVASMKSGKVTGACLDVIEYEDASFEKFDLNQLKGSDAADWNYLVHSDNTVLSPHIAGWTHESNRKMAGILFEKIRMVIRGGE